MNQTAQGLAALGRGPDTMLVHMAPAEVRSLQDLAKAGGGSLTINPDTGLPEAGFLSSLLPMIIGAGITAATGGAAAPAFFGGLSNAAAIGLGVGGVQALRTGSLEKGIMAGLGAYGGAGLAGGLMGAGAESLGSLDAAARAATPVPAGSVVPAAEMAAMAPPPVPAAAATPDLFGGTAGEVGRAYGYTGGAAPVIPPTPVAPPVTATPMPVQSAGDFARFDRAISPSLGASSTERLGAGISAVTASPGAAFDFAKANMYPLGAAGISVLSGMEPEGAQMPPRAPSMIRPYTFSREKIPSAFEDTGGPSSSRERRYFDDRYIAGTPYRAPGPEYMAAGGPVEAMSNANSIGAATGYPQSNINTSAYAVPYQQPMSQNVVSGAQDVGVDPYTGQMNFARGGGVSDLGDYSDGGRLLRGPGDGVSDNIPATIGQKRPARLADGEFVVPARIVSELGNGSTEAGARKLYAMMDRVQKSRKKTVGKGKVAVDSRASKMLPA